MMGENWVSTIFGVCAAVAFCAFVFIVSGREQNADRLAAERFNTCVQAGGEWIPTDNRKGLCLKSPR